MIRETRISAPIGAVAGVKAYITVIRRTLTRSGPAVLSHWCRTGPVPAHRAAYEDKYMLPSEVSQRHRTLVTEVVAQWRRWSQRVSEEPSVPYEDGDDSPEDRDRVVAEVLGRLVGAVSKLDVTRCETATDVDRLVAARVREQIGGDERAGAREAGRLILRKLRIPASIPASDYPPVEDDSV